MGAVCRRFCDKLTSAAAQCGNNDLDVADCGKANACDVPAGVVPCAAEIGDLLDCAIDNLTLLCASSGNPGNGDTGGTGNAALPPQQVSPCQDVADQFEACAKAHGGTDDNMNGNMPSGCYPAGGCKMCANDCTKCQCDAGTDQDKLVACVERCPLTP